MTKWEYAVFRNVTGEQLAHIGEQGWELVSVMRYFVPGPTQQSDNIVVVDFYFKRPKVDGPPPPPPNG